MQSKTQPNCVTCWTAPVPGKKFTVAWKDGLKQFPILSVTTINGVICSKTVLPDEAFRKEFPQINYDTVPVSRMWISSTKWQDLMFAPTVAAGPKEQTCITQFGVIQVDLWRFNSTGYRMEPFPQASPPTQGEKVAGTDDLKGEKDRSPLPVPAPLQIPIFSGDKVGNAPLVSFIFNYKPMALLIAHKIVQRPLDNRKYILARLVRMDVMLKVKLQSFLPGAEPGEPTVEARSRVRAPVRRRKIKQELETVEASRSVQDPAEVIELTGSPI
ncbi:hypothetical protein Hypma_010727 [Hypsizygus marmoreus]|uniref:Uncharacterized protein n=1 Tax=Hypsizygus marmoreus TaxID=39966 RepID=A0A369JP95_HYPMA|nr:hypothetical protein Hypma_010727 [Hypsizygus marmoreus]